MKRIIAAILLVLGVSLSGAAGVSVTGADRAVTLSDLAGTETLVTVVLKDSGAKDANLKVISVTDSTLTVMTQKNEMIPYLLDTLQEVQVQGGRVEGSRFKPDEVQMLRAEQQRVVERAFSRVREIFGEANDDQELKIEAAILLALGNDNKAMGYLKSLAESNDIMTQLAASRALYLVGETLSESLLRQGLESGNRQARALAAILCGLTGQAGTIPYLMPMFNDRAVELSAPAARALARLGHRDAIPRLLTMIEEANETKGDAAVFALGLLGGEDVRAQMLAKVAQTEGKIRYRVARVLYNLDDPSKITELKVIFNSYPTLTPDVALTLSREGDWDATQFLRGRLARREDPTESNLLYRAENAASLLAGGDPSALAVFQDLLRSDSAAAKMRVFELVVELGSVRIIPILQPSIENVDRKLSLGASQAAIALAVPAYRTRLLDVRKER